MKDDDLLPPATTEELAAKFLAWFRPCAEDEPEHDGYVFFDEKEGNDR